MAKTWKSSRTPAPSVEPTTITELARRYHSCAVALAKSLGLPMSEAFLRDHRESVSSIFIAADRAGVRLPSGVQLPPLEDPKRNHGSSVPVTTVPPAHGHDPAGPVTDGVTTVTTPNGHPVVLPQESPPVDPSTNGTVAANATVVASPTVIPSDAGVPCGGVAIVALKPAELAMLVSKVARLVSDGAAQWVPLLAALQAERGARLDRGRKPRRPDDDPDPAGVVEVEGPGDVS